MSRHRRHVFSASLVVTVALAPGCGKKSTTKKDGTCWWNDTQVRCK